ncbi:MAG: glycosyltransferase family 39 protein, partial [Anaerolineae bacterium]|nr:glycosyltransferase family 39 protein [Anaerolineae bacterium]
MTSTLAATPALLWMFAGVGLPWALVSLPRRDWADRVLVACLTLAFGPALVTGWMLLVGMIPQANLLRLDVVLLGTGVLALAGWGIVWRRRGSLSAHPLPQAAARLNGLERLLIGLVGIALVVRWLGVAYWPSTAYDALWVYAYEGKLFTLLGHIPTRIDYYPLFLPLQHTFLQLAVGGVDDHAARAVLPWLHLGSILAVYVLGNRLFNRRTGIIAAAIWALYPHMAEWSRYGDLEVPVTFMFTGAAAFFTLAWTADQPDTQPFRRRYAMIAGLFLGIGMWTKPTMGAFIWGVGLVTAVAIGLQYWQVWVRGEDGRTAADALRPRLEIVLITGLASIPLGAVWYTRNVLLGHRPIDLPPGFWQDLAARSGVELGWLLLALLVLCGWVIVKRTAIQVQPSAQGQKNAWELRTDGILTG